MPTYVYMLSPTRPELVSEPTPAEAEAVGAHAARLATMADDGVVLLAGRTEAAGADTVGIVVFLADDDTHARAIVAADPAVDAGVMAARLEPFHVAFGSPAALAASL